MKVRFYVRGRDLWAEQGKSNEVMIAAGRGFMQSENANKAAEYLRGVASKLTELYNASKVDEATVLLEEAENKVYDAQTAEKFCEVVSF